MNKGMMWVIIIIAFIVGIGVGYGVERNRAMNTLTETKMIMQKEIDDAKMSVGKNMMEKTTITPEPSDAMMKK